MRLAEFDALIRATLDLDGFAAIDASANGLQVGCLDQEIGKAAFAVDASLETFARSIEAEAQLLFVHHGIFWGKVEPITEDRYRRLKTLIDGGLALYAVHLPLDAHPELGNNIGLCRRLGLGQVEQFGCHRGMLIGFKGVLAEGRPLESLARLICDQPLGSLPFGREEIRTVAVVSGGAPGDVGEAIAEGVDLFVTGDAAHTIYHQALEARINVLFAGHYATETWGVRQVGELVAEETDLETVFIDVPTGL